MPNVWIWFPSNEERRKAVLELLDFLPLRPTERSRKALKEAERQRKELEL